MRYSKEPTTIDKQLELLAERGMVWQDEDFVRRWLETVGYYRMSAYWLPNEEPAEEGETRSKKFAPQTSFENIAEIYRFDRRLRLLVAEAIECIEVSLRSRWTNRMALAHGAHAHMQTHLFSSGWEHTKSFAKLASQVNDSSEVFIDHYKGKYNQPFIPALWAVTELMSFGQLVRWVKTTSDINIQKNIANDIGLPTREVLTGTLEHLVDVRNLCAHHARLWNRKLVKRLPKIKNFKDDLVIVAGVKSEQRQLSNRIYNTLVVLIYLMDKQLHASDFSKRLLNLVQAADASTRVSMGFPEDWQERSVWSP